MKETWAERLAAWVASTCRGPIPDPVLQRAAVHLFDTIGCAAGAHGSRAVVAAERAVAGSGPGDATIWFHDAKAAIGDAVLVNGTAVRFLDANDVFLGRGPGGHPSDNIPVAIAAAEAASAPGRDVLAIIAASYELVARLRASVFRASPRGSDWHEVSISGPVAAAMTAWLLGGDDVEIANAIAIGASRGYSLKEIRRGQISLMKAAANAAVAREGVLAALLAHHGLTGPPEAFEGRSGLVSTFGRQPDDEIIEALCAPPRWVIQDATIKPYPAFGTSQAAIAAAVSLHADLASASVEEVVVRIPDTPWAREYVGLEERQAPSTRGTADHSLQFLVAAALLDGDVALRHYDEERWLDPDVRHLMSRTTVVTDDELVDHTDRAFPAAVEVSLDDGRTIARTLLRPPGSPEAPWSWEDVASKFRRLDRVGLGEARIGEIGAAAAGLVTAGDVMRLAEALA